MVTRSEVVAEARSWIGTPFHHQANLKGVGCDCAGLVRGVAIAFGLLSPDYRSEASAQPFIGYSRTPDGVKMRLACETYMVPIDRSAMQPGDTVLIRWDRFPQHIAIVGDYPHGGLTVIHALETSDSRGKVIEQRLDFERSKMRFVSAYAFKGVV